MANTKQAKKRAVQNDKQKARNRAVKSETRRVVKATRAAAPEKAKDMLPKAASSLDMKQGSAYSIFLFPSNGKGLSPLTIENQRERYTGK